MANYEFETLLESMLQCVCELWDAANDRTKQEQLVGGLETLSRRFQLQILREDNALIIANKQLDLDAGVNSPRLNQSIILRAREMLSVVQSSTGLLAKHEQQLTPDRRMEEFQKISQSIQDFAVLLDEATA